MIERRVASEQEARALTDEALRQHLDTERRYADHEHPIIREEARRCLEFLEPEARRRKIATRSA